MPPTPPETDHAARLASHAATVATETAGPVVFPQIGPNGSDPKHLAAAYGAVVRAIGEAIDLAMDGVPHGSDYDEATYRLAMAQHYDRIALLDSLRDRYLALLCHCRAACQERTG